MIFAAQQLLFNVALLILPVGSYKPFETPRNTLLVTGALALLASWWLTGSRVLVAPAAFLAALVYLAWVLGCALQAERIEPALEKWLMLCAAVFVGVFVLPGGDRGSLYFWMVLAAALNALVFIGQRIFGYAVVKNLKGRNNAGLIGNTNILGAYLLPHFFLGAYLVFSEPFGFSTIAPVLSVLLIAIALDMTRCRASMLGLFVGLLATAEPIAALLIVWPWARLFSSFLTAARHAICAPAVPDKKKAGTFLAAAAATSLRARLSYFMAALKLIAARPFFGLGADNFKIRAAALMAGKNGPGVTPTYVHNDFLQLALDAGIPALLLLGWILVAVLSGGFAAAGSGALLPVAALCALLVNGLFFHTQQFSVCQATFWALAGSLLPLFPESALAGTLDAHLVLGIFLLPAAGGLVYRYTIRRQLLDYQLFKFKASGDKNKAALARILHLSPRGTVANTQAVKYYGRRMQLPPALVHAWRAAEHYDGDLLHWEVLRNLGNMALASGAIYLAEWAFVKALSLYPDEAARHGLNQILAVKEQLKPPNKRAEREKT